MEHSNDSDRIGTDWYDLTLPLAVVNVNGLGNRDVAYPSAIFLPIRSCAQPVSISHNPFASSGLSAMFAAHGALNVFSSHQVLTAQLHSS